MVEKSKTEQQTPTEIVPEWHCDIYCRKIRHVQCEGREYAKEGATELCPYFDEMLY